MPKGFNRSLLGINSSILNFSAGLNIVNLGSLSIRYHPDFHADISCMPPTHTSPFHDARLRWSTFCSIPVTTLRPWIQSQQGPQSHSSHCERIKWHSTSPDVQPDKLHVLTLTSLPLWDLTRLKSHSNWSVPNRIKKNPPSGSSCFIFTMQKKTFFTMIWMSW